VETKNATWFLEPSYQQVQALLAPKVPVNSFIVNYQMSVLPLAILNVFQIN